MNKHFWILIVILAGLVCAGLVYRHFAQDVDSRGATRLMRALEENDTQRARELLENGTDIFAQDKSGQTALFYVARHADDPVLLYKLLLSGADPLAQNKHGYTPLMYAAQYNSSPALIKALAKHGGFSADQITNRNQALLVAARHNNATVIKTLLSAHASPAFTTPDGKTAADFLADNEHLSPQEKTDFRQAMLVLEILEARNTFTNNIKPGKTEKKSSQAKTTPAKPVLKQMEQPADHPLQNIDPEKEAATSATDTPLVSIPKDEK